MSVTLTVDQTQLSGTPTFLKDISHLQGPDGSRTSLSGGRAAVKVPRVKPQNPHILFDTHTVTQYHRVVAGLAARYTPQNGRVVDLGCGLGQVLGLLRDERADLELHAADIDGESLELTRARLGQVETTLLPKGELLLDGVGANFDTAILCHSLEHMPSPADALRKALAIVAQGGHLILAVPNPVRPGVFLGNVLRRHYVNPGHVCAWDRSHWMNFLERILALDVVEYPVDEVRIVPQRFTRRVAPLRALQRGLARLLPWWTFSNLAVVRKHVGAVKTPR